MARGQAGSCPHKGGGGQKHWGTSQIEPPLRRGTWKSELLSQVLCSLKSSVGVACEWQHWLVGGVEHWRSFPMWKGFFSGQRCSNAPDCEFRTSGDEKRIEGRMDGRETEQLTYEPTLGLDARCASEDSAINMMLLRGGQNQLQQTLTQICHTGRQTYGPFVA